jgi:hypothetical protein
MIYQEKFALVPRLAQRIPENKEPIPVKVFPNTRSFGACSSLGVEVFVIVSFEGSRPAS